MQVKQKSTSSDNGYKLNILSLESVRNIENMHAQCKYTERTLFEVILKGTEGVSKACSVVSLHCHNL